MPRMTKAQKLAKIAEDAVKVAEHKARMERRNTGWRLAWARQYDSTYADRKAYAFVQQMEAGEIPVPSEAEIVEELSGIAATMRLHDKCREHFIDTGNCTYRDNPASGYTIGADLCEMCSLPLTCGGGRKPHKMRELSQEECRERGIYHGGRCYHVHLCVECGTVRSVDSSD